MAAGRVCEFFLQGRCRFGDNCKNIHPREQNQQNRFAPLSNQSNNSGGRARSGGFTGGDRNRPSQDQNQKLPYHLNHDAIRADFTPGDERPIWTLSAYGPGKEAPRQLIEGPLEQSFEEARLLCWHATQSGNLQQYLQEEANARNTADQQAQSILNDLDGAIKYIIDGENQHPNRNDQVVKNSGAAVGFGKAAASASTSLGPKPAFGQPSVGGAGSAFGQPSQPGGGSTFGQPTQSGGSSAFGQPSQPGNGSAFGQPSQSGSSSSFGQASALGPKPTFGQPTQPAAASSFGQASSLGGGGSFGQPSGLGAKPAFGQPTQPAFGQSAFGQAAKPAFGQASSPFGQQQQQPPPPQNPTASQASQPSGFAAAAGQPSAFGQASQGQQQQSSPFRQPSGAAQSSGFGTGSQAGANPFAANKPSSTSTFGQPTQPAGNGFGQPSQPSGSVFGQPSQPSAGSAAPAPAPAAAPAGNPFAQASQPASGTNGFSGAQPDGTSFAAPASASASAQPNGTATGIAATASYTRRTANGTLQVWKGQQVMYDEKNNPTYQNPQTGKMERIWHPNGPPETANAYAEAPPDFYMGELGALLKDVYDYVRQDEQFKDGIMPEIPPKREWLRWDL